MTRRSILGLAAAVVIAGTAACGGDGGPNPLEQLFDSSPAEAGRLSARPQTSAGGAPEYGLQKFGDRESPHGFLYVPRSYRDGRPAPLALSLPGAGKNALPSVRGLIPFADQAGALVLGIKQQGPTWDYILGGYGPDVRFIDQALTRVFDRYSIDPARVGVRGFSDGASYALAVGLTNGDLFRHVVAHSPGFADTDDPRGSPSLFITHGTDDRTLPIDQTSRQIVPKLKDLGYDVTYREFAGGHDVPRELEPEALSWLRDG